MALPIRDGNQSLTTLSTILVSNSHIPAHTVVSLGAQAITDIATAVSGVELGPNTLNALENITVTLGQVTITGGLTDAQLRASAVTIGGSVTATISGTPSVTFGTAVITGSASILNFPATQTVTFGTSVITGSVSVLNMPATQTVTFGTAVITGSTSIIGTPSVTFTQASVTFGQSTITGSVSVLNLPATQTVTFTTAPVTFGTAVITGSASIIGTPSVTFTQASVTFSAVSISNFPSTQTIAGTVTANLFGEAVGGAPNEPTKLQCDSNGFLITSLYRSGSDAVNYDPVAGNVSVNVKNVSSVTIGNSVTISSLPALPAGTAQIGSVTASISGTVPISISSVTIGNTVTIAGTVTANNSTLTNVLQYDGSHYFLKVGGVATTGGTSFPVYVAGTVTANPTGTQTISGTVTANLNTIEDGAFGAYDSGYGTSAINQHLLSVGAGNPAPWLQDTGGNVPISGTVTIGNSVTIGSLPAISGTVTANNSVLSDVLEYDGSSFFLQVGGRQAGGNTNFPINISGTVTIGAGTVTIGAGTAQIGSVTASISNSVTIASLPAISGTVTANAGTGTFNVSVQGATGEGTITTVTGTSSFTLKASNSNRKLLSVYNEGAGNLHILYGNGTVTTANYSVKLFSGDYLEIDKYTGQVNGLFATAGTARVTQIT